MPQASYLLQIMYDGFQCFQFSIKIISDFSYKFQLYFILRMSTAESVQPVVGGAKPSSIKIQPWTDFPKQGYSIHNDDFVHKNPLVAKFTAKGSKSTLNIKQTVTKKEGKFNVEDDVKLWFDLPNGHSLYTRVKSTDYIKIHYDHGTTNWLNKQWNFYGSLWTDKGLSKTSVRIGAASNHPKCHSDNRLRINTLSGSNSFYWYNRTLSFYKQSKFGIVSVVDLTNRVLQKNNILISHIFKNKHEVFARLENDGYRKANPNFTDIRSLWDFLHVNYVGRLDQTTKVGVQATLNLRDNSLKKVEGVVEKVLPQRRITLKGKLSNKYDAAFVFKRALWGLQDLVTVSFGLGVTNFISEKRSIQQGLQLDFNI